MLGKMDVWYFNSKQSSEWVLIVEDFSTAALDSVSWGAINLKFLVLDLVLLAIYSAWSTGNVSENKNLFVRYAIFCTELGGRGEK